MIYHELGRTGINVSKLCFGSLTMGPFQRNLTPAQGAALFECAFSHGVNFVDTAEIYGTYPHLREAVRLKLKKLCLRQSGRGGKPPKGT